ncbi:hypothetical protein [Funiculus sociatus]|uniref:hypothetical protein n=1 Tax=Funiculus sociatus TaxID=450527 RepID=UPI0019BBDBF0|nr:hypothetical protein [Trichocoleus sp. FACHB-69]
MLDFAFFCHKPCKETLQQDVGTAAPAFAENESLSGLLLALSKSDVAFQKNLRVLRNLRFTSADMIQQFVFSYQVHAIPSPEDRG